MPKSILEACAMNLPVIATDVPGCREIITDNFNGILCMPKNVDSLKSALLKILTMDTTQRIQLGKNGRERVTNLYDEQIVVQSALDCLNKISKK
jgi:glycosyltransferase involved in cell wall biosynthesis